MSIKINIPEDVQFILNTLQDNGYEAYVVGGCVRDSILGREPKDWDITSNALPTQTLDLFYDLGYNIIETGLQHGTITIMINHVGYEVTTYRIDGEYEDNRHPKEVEFVSELSKDLARRDFTMNSLAYNDKDGLIDLFNGLEDLKNELIVCVGNSHDRFSEDALRMLRAVRFSAQLGFDIDCNILNSCYDLCDNLSKVSIERIREEFNKILVNDSSIIKLMYDLGLTDCFIPELRETEFYQNNPYHVYDLYDHSIMSTELIENELHLKLTMLLHDLGKTTTQTTDENDVSHYYGHPEESVNMALDILKRMKYDNETIDKVLTLIKYHDSEVKSKKSIKRMLNRIGEEPFRDLIKVKWADALAQNLQYAKERLTNLVETEQILDEIINTKECFSVKDLAINGRDLIELGMRQGKEIGFTLNKLLEMVIEDNNINNREKLLKIVKS